MQEREKRNNVQTLHGVSKIPSDNQKRTLFDGIKHERIGAVFNRTLQTANEAGAIKPYQVLNRRVLIAIDGFVVLFVVGNLL